MMRYRRRIFSDSFLKFAKREMLISFLRHCYYVKYGKMLLRIPLRVRKSVFCIKDEEGKAESELCFHITLE